ncbi:thioredoxin-dependent thiol peroxidase [Candidatus Soleaferrea massiliensis]|uniref:thioredoxin-dependent thiol peroxidase n=1 Tax=Candidatus Soleaferrea massiliensis TaxID=1470354 RepID=UPI00058FD865|nr:thioredoxin-dependent thiol peroxidase [Candidatus Soleaferrea massiliensis]
MLKEGAKAPDFALPDQNGAIHRLSDYSGRRVVLYFYPKDNTPGCSKQACAFRDVFEQMKQTGAVLIGISRDGQRSHQRFAEKYALPFLLLSDEQLEAIQAYDVWQEKKLYGKVFMGVVRSTFIIDEAGTIIKVYEKAKPDSNAAEVLAYLQEGQ